MKNNAWALCYSVWHSSHKNIFSLLYVSCNHLTVLVPVRQVLGRTIKHMLKFQRKEQFHRILRGCISPVQCVAGSQLSTNKGQISCQKILRNRFDSRMSRIIYLGSQRRMQHGRKYLKLYDEDTVTGLGFWCEAFDLALEA